MKTITKTVFIITAACILFAGNVFAKDFSSYSTEELNNMRGTLWDASAEERDEFRQEWQGRISEMTPEERQQYMGGPKLGNTRNQGYGTQKDRGSKGNA